jgi:hypothetical protein
MSWRLECIMSVPWRIVSVVAIFAAAYFIGGGGLGGLILMVLAVPAIGVVFAKPLVEFWEWYVRSARKHAYEGDDRVFRFGYNEVRVIMWHGGPWFVASEVCNALGFQDVEVAVRHFPAAECATIEGRSGLWLSEAGVEKLAQRSRHPRAREFRVWFGREVMHPFRLARAKEQGDREAMGENP